ncbi:leucine rich repeat domain protein [Aspergillus campestris IBT 28561]|uniref:Leucine rich repeat domain protein n=1 Tax=Aspergillus campestris (strain IBT 28561) TaxID=1392248 RepID=A0A2I1D9M9_ASPC2|nr:leucine rich repeat domain protein [Aspergillus campestris IBT 28561]PKY06566.1 leucine rich repeat domain protein [Aspergillus campestris IBT 28561]
MDNEIPLPPPPRIRHRAPNTPTVPSSLHKTYHQLSRFDDRSSQPSSDPALFSSDDIPASGLENYHAPAVSGCRKRRYRGTWWGEMVKDTKRKRVDFKDKRLVDSGVWMGSDDSGVDSLLPSEDASIWGEELLHHSTVGRVGDVVPGEIAAGAQQRVVFKKVEESREHQLARAIVNDCLEKGQDSVDLSIGGLQQIPQGLLRPLQHLTKLPTVKEAPISEDVYSSLRPFLRMFLAGNSLSDVPGDLFDLDALRVLSLRNNRLTEIPPAIRKLTMLQEVNLAVNELRFLPWELLWLIKKGDLKHLTVRPNPLWRIDEAEITHWFSLDGAPATSPEEALTLHTYEGPAPEEAWAPIHVATGPVRLFNMEGVMVDAPPTNTNESRVPSLREVSLLAFTQSPFSDLVSDTDMANCPGLVPSLLRQARAVRNGGGRCCTVCHRSFVIARAEWIEWWDCSVYENGLKGPRSSGEKLRPLPFRRLGCSWACVPDASV